MSSPPPSAPQGAIPAIGIPDSQDYPRLIYAAPYFTEVPLAEMIAPTVTEAVEAQLPTLVPPYVDAAAQQAVQQLAVVLTGSTMTGPLFLSPLMPTQPAQAATMAYVDSMIATAGIPEVPPVPVGQVWARETSQWVPITPQTGVFLPLAGGVMQGNIAMSGNTINGLAAVPALPNGAAPAQWVLNQIASVSLFQGQWNADTNVPDLTQLSVRVNGYTWIALTSSVDGVVIGPAIPGLQGTTIYNGDTVIYSTVDGAFFSIHAGGLSLPEADARYVQLTGSQMSGALLLNANASQPLQAVTFQQMQTYVPPGVVPEAPNDGQIYGRNGLTASWTPALPLAGGILTGSLTLFGNATAALNPVPLQQMTAAISASTAGFLPLAGGAMSGLMTLSGNASSGLNPVPYQQLTGMLAAYLALSGGTLTGALTIAQPGATLNLNSSADQASIIYFTNPYNQWQMYVGGSGSPGNFLIYNNNSAAAGVAFSLNMNTNMASFSSELTAGGNLLLGGNTIFMSGATGTVNAVGGPLFYADGNNIVMKVGGGAGGLIVQSYSGTYNALILNVNPGGGATFGGDVSVAASLAVSSGGGVTIGNGNVVFTGSVVGPTVMPTSNNTGFVGDGGQAWNSMNSYTYVNASDLREKDQLVALPDCLPLVAAIVPKRWYWKSGPDQEHQHWGFVAQDVGDAMTAAGHDFGGHHIGDDPEASQGLCYNELVAVLWGAVQELSARVDALTR